MTDGEIRMIYDELTLSGSSLPEKEDTAAISNISDKYDTASGTPYFSSIEALYRGVADTGELQRYALLLLSLRSWLDDVVSFDPQSGQPVVTSLDMFLKRITEKAQPVQGVFHDRLYRIAIHTEPALSTLVQTMHTAIIREHTMQSVYAAREIDSTGMQWLSRRPGRTVREKLSGKPFIKAVKRNTTIDIAENRLLKAFILRFTHLIMQRNLLPDNSEDSVVERLLPVLERYRTIETFDEISEWNNTPPNNTLLQDKQYKKIWDGWQQLQVIDYNTESDSRRIYKDILTTIYWKTIALVHLSGLLRLAQQPLCFDYDTFDIIPEEPLQGFLLHNTKAHAIPISFAVSAKRLEIHLGNAIISAWITDDYLWISEPVQKIEKRFPLHLYILDEVPNQLARLIAGIDSSALSAPYEIRRNTSIGRIDIYAIDLCSVRPLCIDTNGKLHVLPFRLLVQHQLLHDSSSFMLDCGTAKAVRLKPNAKTISMKTLFFESDGISEQLKKEAALLFSEKLHTYFSGNAPVYLIPDWINDFNLESIRKSINFYFQKASPLPRSIAAAFTWQLSSSFRFSRISKNDIVLTADSFDDGIVITPLLARYKKSIAAVLPETQGIYWERHPPIIIKNNELSVACIENLKTCGCSNAETIFRLFGAAGLVQEAGKFSFAYQDSWFHLPPSIYMQLSNFLPPQTIPHDIIEECISALPSVKYKRTVFFLPLNPYISITGIPVSLCTLEHEPVMGARALASMQKKLDKAGVLQTLWCDYLPTLAIKAVRNGQYDHIYLVKEATIKPQRGRTVDIHGQESFILPAHQPYYRFPLFQGTGNTALKFAAFLRSPTFPLKEDTLCRLIMTYTYGAGEPYQLHFVPENPTAPFKSIRVQWQTFASSEKPDSRQLPAPVFPPAHSWNDFQHYLNDKGSYTDLLEWCCTKLTSLERLYCFDCDAEVNKQLQQRKAGKFERGDYDKNGNYYCRIQIEGKSVFCHSDNFVENISPSDFKVGSIVYVDMRWSKERQAYYGMHISLSEYSQQVLDIYKQSVAQVFQKHIEKTEADIRAIRFPVLTIWNHGHSLSEPEVPDNFRRCIFTASQYALDLMQNKALPNSLKDELFFFLCCLHKDAPAAVYNLLLNNIDDTKYLWHHRKKIGFSVGNAALPYQKTILQYVIAPTDNIYGRYSTCMCILSIVCWRSEHIIFTLSADELQRIHTILYDCLTFGIKKIVRQQDGATLDNLCKHLELLLALLRTRTSSDPAVRSVFALDSPYTQIYIDLIDTIVQTLNQHGIKLPFRIQLAIDKPKQFHNTPDLLYAIRMFLSADSGSTVISIVGIDEND